MRKRRTPARQKIISSLAIFFINSRVHGAVNAFTASFAETVNN